jgi:hypothetical protein
MRGRPAVVVNNSEAISIYLLPANVDSSDPGGLSGWLSASTLPPVFSVFSRIS